MIDHGARNTTRRIPQCRDRDACFQAHQMVAPMQEISLVRRSSKLLTMAVEPPQL